MAVLVHHQQYLPQIQTFLELPDEQIQGFSDALAKAGLKFNIYDLATDVANSTKVPKGIAEGIIRVLADLYVAREAQSVSLETFLDEQVGPLLKNVLFVPVKKADAKSRVPTAEEIEARWTKFRNFLMVALTLDDSIGTAAKTGPLLTEHERIFVEARILTDARPIFHPDLSEKPHAAVLVHMLRITTRDIFGKKKALYFALDANDIRFMKHLVDRAIKKEETLRNVLDGSGIEVIDPKAVY